MSLIDQALKKTQSALLNQKSRVDVPLQPPIDKLSEPVRPSIHAIPRRYKKTNARTDINFNLDTAALKDFITNRFVMGAISLVLMAALVLSIHTHFQKVTHRYTQFYSHLFQHVTPKASQMTQPVAVVAPKPLVALELNGTMQVGNQHVALVNHQLFHVGETIDGYQIQQIRYNQVVLRDLETNEKRELTPKLSQ